MESLPHNLSRWTTEELLDEAVRRTATDAPALKLLDTIIIRARLAEGDSRFAGVGTQAALRPVLEAAGVRVGTTGVRLAQEYEL